MAVLRGNVELFYEEAASESCSAMLIWLQTQKFVKVRGKLLKTVNYLDPQYHQYKVHSIISTRYKVSSTQGTQYHQHKVHSIINTRYIVSSAQGTKYHQHKVHSIINTRYTVSSTLGTQYHQH